MCIFACMSLSPRGNTILIAFLAILMFSVLPESALAQRPDLRVKKTEEIKPPRPRAETFREAKIIIDGKPMVLSDMFVAAKNKTISVLVLQLQPESLVEIVLEKVGVGTTKTSYECNELGVLSLDVKSGIKKGKALLTVKYFTSDGQSHVNKIYIKIE